MHSYPDTPLGKLLCPFFSFFIIHWKKKNLKIPALWQLDFSLVLIWPVLWINASSESGDGISRTYHLTSSIIPWVPKTFHARFPASTLVTLAFDRKFVGLWPTPKHPSAREKKSLVPRIVISWHSPVNFQKRRKYPDMIGYYAIIPRWSRKLYSHPLLATHLTEADTPVFWGDCSWLLHVHDRLESVSEKTTATKTCGLVDSVFA